MKTWLKGAALLCLLLLGNRVQAQSGYYYQRFDGADTAVADAMIIALDSSRLVNSWQIGRPQKTIFNQALSFPNAMVTDTLNPYPANDSSAFTATTLFNGPTPLRMAVRAIHWSQKIDFDSLHQDGGYVEYAIGNMPWQNIFTSPTVYNLYGFRQQNVDTLPNGQIGFVGKDSVWRHVWLCFTNPSIVGGSTIRLRFVGVSNADSLRGEGWMIDEMNIRPTFAHTVAKVETGHNAALYPQPTAGELTVEADNSRFPQYLKSVTLLDYQGHTLQAYRQHLKRMLLDLSPYPNGVYLLRVEAEKSTETYRIVLKK